MWQSARALDELRDEQSFQGDASSNEPPVRADLRREVPSVPPEHVHLVIALIHAVKAPSVPLSPPLDHQVIPVCDIGRIPEPGKVLEGVGKREQCALDLLFGDSRASLSSSAL
jgi:hypothetical protein